MRIKRSRVILLLAVGMIMTLLVMQLRWTATATNRSLRGGDDQQDKVRVVSVKTAGVGSANTAEHESVGSEVSGKNSFPSISTVKRRTIRPGVPSKTVKDNFFVPGTQTISGVTGADRSKASPGLKRGDSHSPRQRPKVLILTLMHNSEKVIPAFKKLVKNFIYPHSLISIGIGEDSSSDRTIEMVKLMVDELKGEFRRVQFHHFAELSDLHRHWSVKELNVPEGKHALNLQHARRRHLALARNLLVSNTLVDEDYVMWLDSDIAKAPPDIIDRLLAAKKDIVVPICLIGSRLYDWNTWKETQESLTYSKNATPDYLFLEGYGQKRPSRIYADDKNFASEELVEVDGVGGCLLLVKAIHIRKGLTFPSFIFRNQIETEGFSRMAQAMGLKLWLMPRMRVFHACNRESSWNWSQLCI